MGEALRHIHHLEAEAAKENEIAQQAYAVGLDAFDLRKKVRVSLEKEALKKSKDGSKVDINFDLGEEPKEPLPVRYRTNDSSYEALGELLIANPSGILVERDELVSLLKQLDRDEETVARGFYLSGWSGDQSYTFDRILRGHRHIEAVCLSVLGNTQPSRIAAYVTRANADGGGGDGLLQRFGLMVWPDAADAWRNVDEYPKREAREIARQIFLDASKLTEGEALGRGALKGAYDKLPFRFDERALAQFLDWRTDMERTLRSGELSPALEGHIAKYRKLVPALALMNHIADAGRGDVTETSLLKALAFSKYLESHARRVYGASNTVEVSAAQAILARIRKGDLSDGFTARDVHQHDWSGLTDREHVYTGLNLLADLDYIAGVTSSAGPHGGRPKTTYVINPKVKP
jgi:putative DNA primase/helicase